MFNIDFWQGKKVFLTGHTGFKGSWLALWFSRLGAHVSGYALQPPTEPSLYAAAAVQDILQHNTCADIRAGDSLVKAMQEAEPEIVVHMAAQSLVRKSYADPVDTYDTNVMGTVTVFEAIRQCPGIKAVLNITSDKCYENQEWVWGYREIEPMGGHDPYSSSKGCAELVSAAYRSSFFKELGIAVATARAGNVIGGGDWARDRIVPDAMRAFMTGQKLTVRNPLAIRPWQHVLDLLAGYISLCQQLIEKPDQFSESWNFGPREESAQPVSYLAELMVQEWGDGAAWELDQREHPHEAQYLKLDCSKALSRLQWQRIWALERAMAETVRWYKARFEGADMRLFTLEQIGRYQEELARF